MNPVLVLTHNNLDFTKRCVESVKAQDVPTFLFVFDNGSTDGTQEWLESNKIAGIGLNYNSGVSFGWNKTLSVMFDGLNGNTEVFENGKTADHVLVIGNDTILPSWFYSTLLAFDVPFVSGVAVENMGQIACPTGDGELTMHPDFSAWLIRKSVWEKVGKFDESMWGWCSDCDYHYRAHRMGIPLYKSNTPFFHVRSRTIELAPAREKRMLEMQADADRLQFYSKWKARVGSPQYQDLFSPDAFGVDSD